MSLSARVANLEERLSVMEQKVGAAVAVASRPQRLVRSPYIRWLDDNKDVLLDQFPNQWIAVDEDGLKGHNESLEALFQQMNAKGQADVSYIKSRRANTAFLSHSSSSPPTPPNTDCSVGAGFSNIGTPCSSRNSRSSTSR